MEKGEKSLVKQRSSRKETKNNRKPRKPIVELTRKRDHSNARETKVSKEYRIGGNGERAKGNMKRRPRDDFPS